MNTLVQHGRTRPDKLNTFEILCLVLEAVDRGRIPVGAPGTPSFHKIWAGIKSPFEPGRWKYAWEFVRDEEMVVIGSDGRGLPKLWQLTKEGSTLLRDLRLGAFSPLNNIRHRHEPGPQLPGSGGALSAPWA